MLLSTFIPKGITSAERMRDCAGSTPGGMPASGVFSLHKFHVRASLSACLWQSITDALSRAGEIILPVGYSPHFFSERGTACYTLSL